MDGHFEIFQLEHFSWKIVDFTVLLNYYMWVQSVVSFTDGENFQCFVILN